MGLRFARRRLSAGRAFGARGAVFRAVAALVTLYMASWSGGPARAAEVACSGEACAALAFVEERGCIEIRNTDKELVLVTFSVGKEKGLIVLRPYGVARAALADRCVGRGPDDLSAFSVETHEAKTPKARPVAKCTGEACYDIALSNLGGCLTVRNLGNGFIAFEGAGSSADVDPYAETAVNTANGRDCVRMQVSAIGPVTASFRRSPWALDETLVGHCLGDACADLTRRKVDGCVMFANRADSWVRFKMSFVPGNATGITSALYEVAPGKEVMPLPGNMCLRSLAETPYVASYMPAPGSEDEANDAQD